MIRTIGNTRAQRKNTGIYTWIYVHFVQNTVPDNSKWEKISINMVETWHNLKIHSKSTRWASTRVSYLHRDSWTQPSLWSNRTDQPAPPLLGGWGYTTGSKQKPRALGAGSSQSPINWHILDNNKRFLPLLLRAGAVALELDRPHSVQRARRALWASRKTVVGVQISKRVSTFRVVSTVLKSSAWPHTRNALRARNPWME